MSLSEKIALVTGASRGIGKGIAVQLAKAGAVVYITGRTLHEKDDKALAPGSLEHTVNEIKAHGGKAIAVQCDHSRDEDTEKVFQQILKEHEQLHILVNCAFSAVPDILKYFGKLFWEMPETFWDDVNNVGLRNYYICAVKAAKVMTKQKSGLIVNISSGAGKTFYFTPAYGVGKAANDRMAADCAWELKAHNVTFVSLWPGHVKTEQIQQHDESGGEPLTADRASKGQADAQDTHIWEHKESAEFVGSCVVALATDQEVLKKTGKHHTTESLGKEYGIKDEWVQK